MTIGLIIISIGLLIIEVLTASTFFIWFALGGFAAAITSLFTDNILIIVVVFAITSIGLMVSLKQNLQRRLAKNNVETSYEKIIGKSAIVTRKITPTTPGEVKVAGQIWSARSEKVHNLEEEVTIVKINGSHVIVK